MTVKPNSQNGRILAALASGRWQTTSTIHHKAGTCRLNSRISELRREHGYQIEHERVPGVKDGPRAHRYRLVGTPDGQPIVDLAQQLAEQAALETLEDETPRTPEHRFRLYAVTDDGALTLVATCPSEEAVGVAICTLGREGHWGRSCIGLLDTHGTDEKPGEWVVNPWEVL